MIESEINSPTPSVNDLVAQWTSETGDTLKLNDTRDLLTLLDQELYADYQPFPESSPFLERLAEWLHNVRDDKTSQQLLFNFVPWLLFIGRKEMETMYRAAFTGPITRWIIEDAGLDIAADDLSSQLETELKQTWFGCLAGMDIGSFMRINGLDEQSLRPDFRVLSYFVSEPAKITDYLREPGRHRPPYKRIVAVEDYVGTGSQLAKAARVLEPLSDFPTLICPIVAAPMGVAKGRSIQDRSTHIKFREHFQIPPAACLEPEKQDGEPVFFEPLRQLVRHTWDRIKTGEYGDSPFGFCPPGMTVPASLALTYLNCPNNTPPLVHRKTSNWEPLFPRLVRET